MKGKSGTAQTTTDAQGRFFIPLVETGDYTLSFAKAMYETMIRSIAIDNFAEVLYLQTASYWQLLDAALAALGKKDLGRAEEYLSRAKTIQSQSATSLFLDAVVAELRGDYEVAVRAMERSVEIDPRSAFSWLYLADLYERSGAETDRIARALEAYLKLRDDPVAAEREKRLLHR